MRCCFCVEESVSESNSGGDASTRYTDKMHCAILATCEKYQVLVSCC
jgi:hypothetical protein